jgi:general secretion pathway protein D
MINRLSILLFGLVCLQLVSCAKNEIKESGEVKDHFQAHLQVKERPEDQGQVAAIPEVVRPKPVIPPPRKGAHAQKGYTITAFDAPVEKILFSLAEKSGHQIDIWQGVQGTLTINAVNQPLEDVLARIAAQLDLDIQLNEGVIVAKSDLPYWRNYRVDYVNIKRSSRDSIVMNMTVGGSVNPVAGGQVTGSRSVVEVASEHDFWNTLHKTLLSMTRDSSSNQQEIATPVAVDTNEMQSSSAIQATNQSVQSNVVVNAEAGLVMVYANIKRHQQVRRYIDDLTQRTERQVMIEASVVEVALSKQHQSGIDWSNTGFKNLTNRAEILAQPDATPLADNLFTATLGEGVGLDLNVGLKMLERFGDVQVLSSPKIMAVNNQSALLKVVDNEVYFTVNVSRSTSTAGTDVTYSTTVHTVPVGFMMSMTPFVNDKREVSINIRPTISRIIGTVTDPNPDLKTVGVESLIPVVQEREMETVLKLRDRQTAVIGGLIEDRKDRTEVGISWLSRIPIVGKSLFGYQENGSTKTELVIFIRPVIVENPDIEQGDLNHYRSFLKAKTEVLE